MGGDGASGSMVAKDAFGFGIHYFGVREYTPVSTSVKPFAAAVGNSPLFNGNISAISQNISTIGTPLEYTYSYDVLNRIAGMTANKGLDSLNNSWTNTFTALSDFKEAVTYDGNGNILTYNRNGNKTFAGSPLGMDSLTYHYRPGTNKLSYVTDLVRGTNYGNDIDNQSIGNYKYDSIGNMVSDVRSGVDSIKWTVYGKISKIYKHDSTIISYTYDVAGNRISKTVGTVQTFYVRDATGNILSTYTYGDTSVNNGQLSQIEANLYGSSRLGMTTLATNVQDTTPPSATSIMGLGYGKNVTFTRGKKFFELTNHLSNVLATVSDRKTGVSLNNSTIDSYNPVINSAQEYYPFGMLMPGRGGHIGTGKNVAGSTVIIGGNTIPSTLTVTQRTNNLPATYMATQMISFEGEFGSGAADEFTTLFVDQANADPGTESGISYGIAAKGYRYGFNGKENDNEAKGEGNEQDYGMRIYDPRIGKFLSVDPITAKYPELTPYQFASNRPIDGIDLDGLEYLRYRLNINGTTGQIMSSEVIWHNPNQHNEFGPLGKGVLYDISINTWDSWFKVYRSENIQKMVHRNATTLGFKSEYGNYLGATGLFKVDKLGHFSIVYDYTLDAVDAVDNFAKLHDQGYDRVRAVGETGLKEDWGTTPYDEAAMNGWQNILDNYKVGDRDPFNGQKITSGELSLAWNGNRSFRYIVSSKKESIVKFMKKYYSKETNNYHGDGWGINLQKALQAAEDNYQLFLNKYMTKDADGNWIRQGNMWHKENGNWTPNKPN